LLNRDQARVADDGARSARGLVCASVVASCFTLFGCARLQSCSGEQPVTERAQSPLSAAESDSAATGKTGKAPKSRHSKRPVIKNTGDAWLALKFFLPDILEGYRARMAIEGRDISLGADLGLLSVRRAYGNKADLVIEVELIDVTACERVRDLFNRSRELQRDTEKAVIRPMRVHGQKALSQWLDATKTARTSVLVADRFLVNANVKPADSTAPSIAFVETLDWAALEQFATAPIVPPETAALASQPP
jgi:hypothetical protein